MENECDIDPIDKEGILNSSSAEVEIHNDEIAFYMTLYSYYQMNCRVKKQNEWMNQAYEQLVGDYNFYMKN